MRREASKSEGRLGLARATDAGLDRALPARPAPFVAVVLAASAALWLLGWALAADRGRLLASREWIAQPLYLAVHLALLRLFVTVYASNFAAGCANLDAPGDEVRRAMRRILGPLGVTISVLLAAPLVVLDVRWLEGKEYLGAGQALGAAGSLGPSDYLMVGVWALEWLVNAYVWVVIVGFLAATLHLLRRHGFRATIERVLRERHYRPFLMMSAQGASLTLAFAVASALYVWWTKGAASDYVGLWVTAGLVLVGFVPPWLQLKKGLGVLVEEESERLSDAIEARGAELEAVKEGDGAEGSGPSAPERVEARVRALLAIARWEHLQALNDDLGKSEGKAVLLRLLAPLGTVGWRLFKPF